MLTMGKPMRLICERPMGRQGEMFGERIRGNHQQIRGHFDPVDILHFLSAPPEVYLAENGMTVLVNQQDRREIQNFELSLVNNLLNRVLVSGHMMFTYQDRVFVENILKKLGVWDVQGWIGQVRMMKEMTITVNELLALYEAGEDTIRQISAYRREAVAAQKEQEEGPEKENREAKAAERFFNAVLHRLQTAAVYREISSYAAFRFGDRTRIDRRELAFGGQHIAASYLTLNDYRRRITQSDRHMVYDLARRYETWEISHVQETQRQPAAYLLQTALLQAVSRLFSLRYADFSQHKSLCHEFMDALHVSVRNTFENLSGLSERIFLSGRDKEAYHRLEQHFERQEIKALKSLFLKHTKDLFQAPRETEDLLTANQSQEAVFTTHGQKAKRENAGLEKEQPLKRTMREKAEHTVERMEEIKEWLEQINRHNIERLERLAEYESRIEKSETRLRDRRTANAAAKKALAGRVQSMTPDREREPAYASEQERDTEKLREILGDETVRVFETIRGYQENPARYPQVTTLDGQAMNLFLRDIAAAGAQQTVIPEIERESIVCEEKKSARHQETESEHPLQGTGMDRRSAGRGQRTKRIAPKTEPFVELLHRKSGQMLSEERLHELMQTRSKDKQILTTTLQKKVDEKEQVTKIVHEKVKQMMRKQDEEIARLISQSVKGQLDTLSEKVYGKLEKRMDAERRRRGI